MSTLAKFGAAVDALKVSLASVVFFFACYYMLSLFALLLGVLFVSS